MLSAILLLTATAVTGGGTTAPILLVVIALMGSGGLGYFLDRRSAQASRLANDAVNATTVFQAALDEERSKRNELERELTRAKQALTLAVKQTGTNSSMIDDLHTRIQALERDLLNTIRDMNEIIRTMFSVDESEEDLVTRWREVMVTTKLAVIQSDQDVTIVFISAECADLLGYDQDELLGKPVQTVIADHDYNRFRRGLQEARRAEVTSHSAEPFRLSMLTKDGEALPVLMALGVHKSTITLLIRRTGLPRDPGDFSASILQQAVDSP